jgi:hypothetical protein
MLSLKNKEKILKVAGLLRIPCGSSALPVLRRSLIWPVDCIRSLYRPRFRYLITHPSRILCDGRMHRWQARPFFDIIFTVPNFTHVPYRSPVLLHSPDQTPLPISRSVPYHIGARDVLRTIPNTCSGSDADGLIQSRQSRSNPKLRDI